MSKVIIDRDILECAIKNLNVNELRATLESCGETINIKDKKYEMVTSILNKLDEGKMTEKLYLALKTRAFSNTEDFYDGFFYKYNTENIDFNTESFMKYLKEEGEKENSSLQSNVKFTHEFYNKKHDEYNKIFSFTFVRESKKGIYDQKEDVVKFFHNKIQAGIEIYYEKGLVYIHSKNSSESTTIKVLIQSTINKLLIESEGNKTKLYLPKFDNTIVEKWSKDSKINVKGISVISIHMLDLLCEFEKKDNGFTEFSIKRIYLENEIIDASTEGEDFKIFSHIVLGENLQNAHDIFVELSNGKKLTGFELLVNYQYDDIEYRQKLIAPVVIRILQNKHDIRISLSKEDTYVKEVILSEIYTRLQRVFINKVNSKNIQNEELLKKFVGKCTEIKKKEDNDIKSTFEVY